jgi:hypothetical protein
MNTNPENFETLRKALAIKRHEVPPPGYFNNLSSNIAARIERGECELTFWERLHSSFTLRPAFAYAFAIAAFGTFTASVLHSGKPTAAQALHQEGLATALGPAAAPADFAADNDNPFSAPLHVPNWLGNTNPGAPPQVLPSLFAPQSHAVTVSYEYGN